MTARITHFLWIALVLTASTCKKMPEPEEQKDLTVHVTDVDILRENLELTEGETFRLGARVTPANATNARVSWSSDNAAVASVGQENGLVTAISTGKATITVTTVDGGFTDTCPVTVSEAATPPTPTPTDPGEPAAFGAVPSKGQLAWQRQELLMFYHFGQATFSGWDGENPTCNGKTWSESLLLQNYNPSSIDADQWVKTAHDNGFKEVIITAKHHDGFCLWDNPESTTDVANAACKNHTDVVKAIWDACNKYGVNMGIYLSPWDRMIEASGKSIQEYEKMYKSALNDLMTQYSPVVEMWFDGNHAGAFDWPSVNKAVLDVNPECVIFSNGGPGCRWVGNEQGVAGETNWATLDRDGRHLSPGNLPGDYGSYLGSGDKGASSWVPAECDFSIQQIGDPNGWFYGADDSRKTARELMDLYYKSVGRNSVFLMNVPPSDKGVIDNEEVKIIEEFRQMRESVFGENLADGATATATSVRGNFDEKYGPQHLLDSDYDTYFATDNDAKTVDIEFRLDGSKTFNRLLLQEYIPLGQRVESFEIQVLIGGKWESWGRGEKTTIGHKRIVLGNSVTTEAVKVRITKSLACPVLNGFGLYNDTVSGL